MSETNVSNEFYYKYCDLYTSDLTELRSSLSRVAEQIRPGILSGPLFAWIFELAVNALKATYKKVYQITMLEPLGLDDISYERWLELFKTEIEEHNAENFAHYCQDNGISIEITGQVVGDVFRIDVSNEGVPSQEEWERIQMKLERARGLTNLIALLEEDDEDEGDPDQNRKEGGGLGISLIVVGLRGLALDTELFQILEVDGKTVSRIDLPLTNSDQNNGRNQIDIKPIEKGEIPELLNEIYTKNNFQLACFDKSGHLISFSPELLIELGYDPEDKSQILEFNDVLSSKFINDIFSGSRSVHVSGRFDNYRLRLSRKDKSEQILYNITGHLNDNGNVTSFWNQVVRGGGSSLTEGNFGENKQLYTMIEPYVPSLIRHKAKEVLDFGQSKIPDELIDRTILFADLEGFTRQSEITEPAEILGLLNKVFGMMVKHINKYGGHVEKFMGDAVLATFNNPYDATRASISVQNKIYQMNQYRQAGGAVDIRLRIGINSGKILMGNIGSGDSRDWTPLGDVVNTASRIEKNGVAGGVHLSESSFQRIKKYARVNREFLIHAKGKKEEVKVYSISGIRTTYQGKPALLKLMTEK